MQNVKRRCCCLRWGGVETIVLICTDGHTTVTSDSPEHTRIPYTVMCSGHIVQMPDASDRLLSKPAQDCQIKWPTNSGGGPFYSTILFWFKLPVLVLTDQDLLKCAHLLTLWVIFFYSLVLVQTTSLVLTDQDLFKCAYFLTLSIEYNCLHFPFVLR